MRIVSANLAFCRALGVSREELLGQTTDQFLGDAGPASARIDLEVITTGKPRLGVVESYPAPDGLHWVVTDKAPIFAPDGRVVGLIGTSTDITAQRESDEKLRKSESQLRFLTEHMADILWTMDLQFHTTFVTPSVERVLGFTPEERRLQSLPEMVTPESAGRILAELERQLQYEVSGSAERDRTLTIDVEYYRANGSTIWMETLIQAVRDDAGILVGMSGVSRDITERRKAEEALRRSETQLRFLTDNTADVIWTMDLEFHTTYISPSVKRVLGFTPDEWMRLPFDRMATPDSVAREYAALQRELTAEASGAADPHRTLTIEVEMNHKDGSTVWMEMVIRAIRDDTGKLVGMVGVSRDITERRRGAEALRQSEEQYRALFDLSKDAAYLVSPDGHFLEVNRAWIDLFGYSRDEASKLHVEAIYEDPRVRSERFLPAITQEGEIVDWEVRFKKKDGTVMDCLCSVVARRDNSGAIICLQGMARDITGQKRAHLALKESEEKYRTLFEQSVDAVNLVGVDGRIIEANPAWFSLFGYTPDDLGSYNAADVYVEPEGRARFLQAIATRNTVEDELQFKRKDGSVFDCHRIVTVRQAAGGNIVGYQTVFHDVTETRRAERALRESEQRFRMVLSRSPVIMAQVDRDLRYVWIHNPHPDFDQESTRGKRDDDLADNEGTRQLMDLKRYVVETGRSARQTISFPASDGVRTYDVAAEPLIDDAGTVAGATTVAFDISERKRAEQSLRESEEKYHQLFDQSLAPISLLAPDGHLIEANDAWFRMFRYSREDTASIRATELYPTPELREASVQRLLESGALVDDEAQVKTKDGALVNVLRSMVVRHNPDGSVLGYQTVWLDITELKQIRDELYASREQLRRLALRMQVVREEERTTIARDLHDHFSQELTALRFDLDSLRRSAASPGDPLLQRIDGITKLVDRMSQEMRQVISEMRPGMLDDLGLRAAIDWQAGQFSERTGIACHLDLSADDAVFSAELNTTLFRVLQEVLSNVARHSGASSVRIDLTSTGNSARLTVSDDGHGITDEEISSPSSLGILGIRERLHACGGTLEIHGTAGLGSTVTATAPIFPTSGQWQARLGLH